jgi:hypothetical protein
MEEDLLQSDPKYSEKAVLLKTVETAAKLELSELMWKTRIVKALIP